MATGYKFTISGQYYSSSGKDRTIKRYANEEFVLPEIVEYVSGREFRKKVVDGRVVKRSVPVVVRQNALRCYKHIIRRYHLVPRLAEKYEDFADVRTFHIMKKERVQIDDSLMRSVMKTPIADMTESELLQFHAIADLNCVLGSYPTLADKKIVVETEYNEKKAQEKTQDEKVTHDSQLTEPSFVHVDDSSPAAAPDPIQVDESDPINAFI